MNPAGAARSQESGAAKRRATAAFPPNSPRAKAGEWKSGASLRRFLAVIAGLMVLSGCGGGGPGLGSRINISSAPVANTIPVAVNSGPANNALNAAYVTVTVCNPGSTANCATIPDVQVDTGSSGLRILASAPGASGLTLTQVTGTSGAPVNECYQFGVDYLWGPVVQADVSMGGEKAASLPLQLIAGGSAPASTTCASGGGNNLNTPTLLAANGILGVGAAKQDCGILCTVSPVLPYYWLCPTGGTCTTAQVPAATQVSNPVAFFTSDNNGVALTLGTVAPSGAASATGTLTFGIGTQTDNALSSSAKVYALSLNSQGYASIFATYNGVTYPTLIDSTEIYTFFLDPTTVAAASAGAGIYSCPSPTPAVLYCTGSPSTFISLPFTAKDNSGDSAQVSINVGNGASQWDNRAPYGPYTAFGDLAGGLKLAHDEVILGMPFFYGRTVYVGIAGEPPPSGIPVSDAGFGYWAF